jgi:acyl carrier protein
MKAAVMSSNLQAQLYLVIAEEFDREVSEIDLDMSIRNDLGADAVKIHELILAIEIDFLLLIPSTKIKDLRTVQDILDLLVCHTSRCS